LNSSGIRHSFLAGPEGDVLTDKLVGGATDPEAAALSAGKRYAQWFM